MAKRVWSLLSTRLRRTPPANASDAAVAPPEPAPGSAERGIGEIRTFLEDVRARGFAPAHVLDVGAHRGDWSQLASGIFRDATFTLVEPQQEMKADLDAFCSRHPGSTWVQAGAGAEPGELEFTVWPDLAGSSFVPTPDESVSYGHERRSVPVVTIDRLLADADRPIPELVKLDVQGYELEALRGGASLFGHTELFVLEISLYPFSDNIPTMEEVVAFMAERGYLAYDLCGFLRRPYDGALGQIDIAFARRDGQLRASNRWL